MRVLFVSVMRISFDSKRAHLACGVHANPYCSRSPAKWRAHKRALSRWVLFASMICALSLWCGVHDNAVCSAHEGAFCICDVHIAPLSLWCAPRCSSLLPCHNHAFSMGGVHKAPYTSSPYHDLSPSSIMIFDHFHHALLLSVHLCPSPSIPPLHRTAQRSRRFPSQIPSCVLFWLILPRSSMLCHPPPHPYAGQHRDPGVVHHTV